MLPTYVDWKTIWYGENYAILDIEVFEKKKLLCYKIKLLKFSSNNNMLG